MYSALSWVAPGCANPLPAKYEPTPEEIAAIAGQSATGDDQGSVASDDPDLQEFNLEQYDEDEAGPTSLMAFKSNKDDPYLTLRPDGKKTMHTGGDSSDEWQDEDEEASEEIDDFKIRASDALLLLGRSEDENYSTLEVHVYEPMESNLYVHHDIILPAFPLCLEWNDFKSQTERGNFVAIGTFQPEIEIWDLDVVDTLQPAVVLGGEELDEEGKRNKPLTTKQSKKKGKKGPKVKLRPGSHSEAVLSLSWNPHHRQGLASGSADKTVKIWDLSTQQCAHTFKHHHAPVQVVKWNPAEPKLLLSGSFDKTAVLFDVTAPSNQMSYALSGDIECASWAPHSPQLFLTATEGGTVCAHDARNNSKPLFTLDAHEAPITSMLLSPDIPGLMVTTSVDRSVKVWDINGGKPSHVVTRTLDLGAILCAGFVPTCPLRLGLGGDQGTVLVWDMADSKEIKQRYGKYITHTGDMSVGYNPVSGDVDDKEYDDTLGMMNEGVGAMTLDHSDDDDLIDGQGEDIDISEEEAEEAPKGSKKGKSSKGGKKGKKKR